jgi:Rrf2 family nitric oxide-sensitive transcriptional repressor
MLFIRHTQSDKTYKIDVSFVLYALCEEIPMKLTSYTDYALRTLMYLALNRDELVTIQQIADVHNIAKTHLNKVVNHLTTIGVVESVRGRNGGLRLGMEPEQINIGEVVRNTENDFYMAECFDSGNQGCIYSPTCALKGVLSDATSAFLNVLDGVTLEKVLQKGDGKTQPGSPEMKPVKVNIKSLPYKPKKAA